MFVSFPIEHHGRIDPTEMPIEIDDIRRIVLFTSNITLLLMDNRAGRFETFSVRMSYLDIIEKVKAAKLHAASSAGRPLIAAKGEIK